MLTCHSAEQIFIHAAILLDVLHTEWKNTLLSITTDKEREMTGHAQGDATCFEQVAKPGYVCIWCGLHHLDLCLQKFYL